MIVEIDYTNWRKERGTRTILPVRLMWENNEWHPETQWILYAVDQDKNKLRCFAMKDIHSWKPVR